MGYLLVLVTLHRGLQLVFSNPTRIGDTKYLNWCSCGTLRPDLAWFRCNGGWPFGAHPAGIHCNQLFMLPNEDALRASPPCRVKGSWQALWRGALQKNKLHPSPIPLFKVPGLFKLPAPLTILAGESCSLLRPYSGLFLASATCVKAYMKYSWHLFYMKSEETANGGGVPR